MKLRKRQKRKTAQALDAAAGVTKVWSEWQIGKRATKGVVKVKKTGLKARLASKPVRFAGLAALLGGAGAALSKKAKGGGREPIYTPPGEGEPVAPPDVAPPLAIAPEPATPTDATMPQGQREAAVGAAGLRPDASASASAGAGGGDDDGPAPSDSSPDAPEVEPDAPTTAPRTPPTYGGVDPAVPSDEPVVEPMVPSSEPEPIADKRGGDATVVAAKDLQPDKSAVANDD